MEAIPVVCGIDIGSWTYKVCVFDGQKFDIVCNEANFRQTPSLVAFTQSQRLIGEEALNKIKTNYANTIRAPMRLIGLERHFSLLQQELKNSTSKYQVGEQLSFYVSYQDRKRMKIHPQHLLMALMGKIKRMIQINNFKIHAAYISVPSYMSHYQRTIVKKCAESIDLSPDLTLIDDWVALASEYSYCKYKELKLLSLARNVLFVDIGFSKISLGMIEFSSVQARLLDIQHMRFTGSKNIDHHMAQFYDKHFKKQRKSDNSVFSTLKSYVKLSENIQKQRKILSANNEHVINIQYLMEQDDLNYNMTRQEFESICMPTFTQIATTIQNMKARIPVGFKINSIQLIGGASRIPLIQTIISNVFGIQSQRTLNQSQSMVQGTTIYGAMDKKCYKLEYSVKNINILDINVGWNRIDNGNFFGEDGSLYTRKQVIFPINCKIPNQNTIHIGNEGLVEMYIFYEQNISTKSIGYLRFRTPNKINFTLDKNKIIRASVTAHKFEVSRFYEKDQDRWQQMRKWELEMQKADERIQRIYQIKNQYEGNLYSIKDKLNEYRDILSQDQLNRIYKEINAAEAWIEQQNAKKIVNQNDFDSYADRLNEVQRFRKLLLSFEERRNKNSSLKRLYDQFRDQLNKASTLSLITPKIDYGEANLKYFPQKGILMHGEEQTIRVKYNSQVKPCAIQNIQSFDQELSWRLMVKYTYKTDYNKQYLEKYNMKGWEDIEDEREYQITVIAGEQREKIQKFIKQDVLFGNEFGKDNLNLSAIKQKEKSFIPDESFYNLQINSKNDVEQPFQSQRGEKYKNQQKENKLNNSLGSNNSINLLQFGQSRVKPMNLQQKKSSNHPLSFNPGQIAKSQLVLEKLNNSLQTANNQSNFLIELSKECKKQSIYQHQKDNTLDIIILAIIAAFFVALGNNVGRLFR